MRWADQLIKLSTFELELLQKRLAGIVARRVTAEARLKSLTVEGEAEIALAKTDPEAAWRLDAFTQGLKQRKAAVQRTIDEAAAEEAGARDALAEGFETLKKYEKIAENARLETKREADRQERAALDDLGLRRRARRR
jgi:flagellar FliJ protein